MAEDLKEPTPDTPELILKDAVLRSNQLDKEAERALFEKRDTATQRQKLTERAELIAGLYARVEATVARGQSFPEEGLNDLKILSDRAKKALGVGRGHSLALIVFLTPRGQLEGQPDLLEEIVNKLYPPKTEVIK